MAKRYNRILLTGAAGNLGKVLRESLPAHCEYLRISDRDEMTGLARNEEAVVCDLADTDACMALTQDVDVIIHMGGQSIEDTWDSVLNSNIIGFYNIYEGCRKNNVKRLIWGSSNHAIGFYPRTQVIDASVYPRPDTNYGVSKVFGEALAQYYWDKYHFESVSIRIGSCFPEPLDRRMLATWLSYPDYKHLIDRCLMAPRVEHTIVYGMSDNNEKLWDNTMASHLGFRPKDNAEDYREKVEAASDQKGIDDPMFKYDGGGFTAQPHFEDAKPN